MPDNLDIFIRKLSCDIIVLQTDLLRKYFRPRKWHPVEFQDCKKMDVITEKIKNLTAILKQVQKSHKDPEQQTQTQSKNT